MGSRILNGAEIGEHVTMIIPTAEAEIDAADERYQLVDTDQFLVMRPEERSSGWVVVRVTHHFDVLVEALKKRWNNL